MKKVLVAFFFLIGLNSYSNANDLLFSERLFYPEITEVTQVNDKVIIKWQHGEKDATSNIKYENYVTKYKIEVTAKGEVDEEVYKIKFGIVEVEKGTSYYFEATPTVREVELETGLLKIGNAYDFKINAYYVDSSIGIGNLVEYTIKPISDVTESYLKNKYESTFLYPLSIQLGNLLIKWKDQHIDDDDVKNRVIQIIGEDDFNRLYEIDKDNDRLYFKIDEDEFEMDEWYTVQEKIFFEDGSFLESNEREFYFGDVFRRFKDIEDHFADDKIAKLIKAGIIKGTSYSTFSPDENLTREQFVTLLGRALGIADKKIDEPFVDVPSGRYSEQYINAFSKLGIVEGYGDNEFGPQDHVTKEQMAKILVEVYAYYKERDVEDIPKTSSTYDDIDEASEWAKIYISKAKRLGVTNVKNEDNYRPKDNGKRDEAAVMIYNLLRSLDILR